MFLTKNRIWQKRIWFWRERLRQVPDYFQWNEVNKFEVSWWYFRNSLIKLPLKGGLISNTNVKSLIISWRIKFIWYLELTIVQPCWHEFLIMHSFILRQLVLLISVKPGLQPQLYDPGLFLQKCSHSPRYISHSFTSIQL